MKSFKFLIVSALTFVFHLTSFSQYHCLKIDGLGLVRPLPVFRAAYEFSYLKHFSVGAGYENGKYNIGYYYYYGGPPHVVSEVTGWGVFSDLRYYPFCKYKPAPHGLFIGVNYRYRRVTEIYTGKNNLSNNFPLTKADTISITSHGNAFNYGFHFGYKANIRNLVFECVAGFGRANGAWMTPNQRDRMEPIYKIDLSDVSNAARFEISVGLVFPKFKPVKIKPDHIPSLETKDSADLNYATVHIYRPKAILGFGVSYDLHMKDTVVAKMQRGTQKTIYTQEAGEVEFWAETEDKRSLIVILEKGKVYYLKCSLTMGFLVGHPKLQFVDPKTGEEDINLIRGMKKPTLPTEVQQDN